MATESFDKQFVVSTTEGRERLRQVLLSPMPKSKLRDIKPDHEYTTRLIRKLLAKH